MSFSRRATPALVVASAILCIGQHSAAAESGSYTAVTSMTTRYTTIAHAGGTVFGGASEGTSTVVESSGGPFVAGRSAPATCIVYGKSTAAGTELEAACTSTGASGDQVFSISKRSAGDVAEGGGGAGDTRLLGGTGKYDGVTGSCTYKADYLPDNRYVTLAECSWQR